MIIQHEEKQTVKIYTKSGDSGQTSLFRGGRVSKDDVRVDAYGQVDELNAVLGFALAQGLPSPLASRVERVQVELFDLGADLATPTQEDEAKVRRFPGAPIERLEAEIDQWSAALPPLRHFILPGGARGGAALQLARAVCRRAERSVVRLSRNESLNPFVLRYLNRLSDWLFVAARVANQVVGQAETRWFPPQQREK